MTNAACPRCNGRGYTIHSAAMDTNVHAEPCDCTKPERFTMTSLEYWLVTLSLAVVIVLLFKVL